ncbi:MAG TPA: ATP-binding protein [Vicinamibacteria bacterium]|nr:ATP-binding protein [Vicinamibacteria bacterium]
MRETTIERASDLTLQSTATYRAALAVALALAPALLPADATKAESLLPITTFSVGEGLPSALVYQLAQDASGRIWILNREGVVAYDGASFEPQGVQQGLVATQCAGLTIDDRGRALVAAFDGRVFRNEGGVWQRQTPPLAAPFSGQVLSLAHAIGDGRERFLVSSTDGLWLWDQGSWRRQDRAEDRLVAGSTSLSGLGEDLFVGTPSGLCRLRGALDCAFSDDPRLREPILALNTALIDGRPSLLLLSHRWLGALVDGRLRLFGPPLDFDLSAQFNPRDPPRTARAAISLDPTGAVFFGTRYRGYMLEPGASRPRELGSAQGLMGDGGVTSILTDREGAIWIGSLRGLTRVGSRRFLSLDARSGLAENEVVSIAEFPGGRFVLGHNAGLTFLDRGGERIEKAFEIRELSETFRGGVPRLLDLAIDSSGTVWAAASIALLEIGRDQRVAIHRFPDRAVSVEVDRRGRLFVLGAQGVYVQRAGRFEKLPFGFPKGPSLDGSGRWLATDGGDRLFVASRAGLLWRGGMVAPELDPKTVWHRAVSADKRGDNVYTVFTTPAGEVLVGTAGGLYRLAGEALEAVEGPLALERPVYFLLRDRSGKLWAGTDDGVFVAEPGGFRQLSIRHGLAGRETNRGAGLVDSMGRVWIGTDQGLSVYREALDVRLSVPPTVEIQGLDVEGERRPVGDVLDLRSSPRSLVFHARTINFSAEERVVCRYRLEGLNEEWQGPAQLTTTGIRYTHIPPGRYRLRIAAAWSAHGPWGPESVSGEIRIPTPWTQRPAVWILGLLALGTLLFTGHQLRLRALGRRNAQLESFNERLRASVAERQRLISELEAKNAELERFTYTVSHDLKAPLVTIRGFAALVEQDASEGRPDQLRLDIQRIHKAAETMSLLLNQLLDLSRIGRVVGPPETLPLGPLILEAARRVPSIETAQLVVDPDLPAVAGDRTRMLEVFENLLGNAVKFMGAQAAPRIEVGLQQGPGPEPVIVVSDNGIGIDPRFKDKVFDLFERLDKKVAGTGIGLAIVKRIVEFHGGRIWVESTGAPGEGSRFCLTLPKATPSTPASQAPGSTAGLSD